MFQKAKLFFTPPVFDDEDRTRIAGLLNTISLAILVILVIVSAVSPFLFQEAVYGVVTSAITALPVLVVLLLVRSGRVRLASHLFVFGFWILDTVLIYVTGGLNSGVAPGYIAVIVLAGLLLGRRSTLILFGLAAATGLGMVYAEHNGFLPDALIYIDPLARWLSLIMNAALSATLLDLATGGVKKALDRARRGEQALETANLELVKEIAERKRTETELRQLKEFNENIVQSVAETIIIEDQKGILTFANPRIEKLLGYSPGELIGKHWNIIVTEKSLEKVRDETGKRPEGIESQYEISLLKKDGTEIPVITSARPLFKGDEYIGVLSAFTDITDLKRVEKELRETHQQLNTTLDALPDLLFEVDKQGHILSFHAPETGLLYASPGHFLGKVVEDVLPESPARAIRTAIDDAILYGRHTGTIYSLDTPRGLRWFELSMAVKGDPQATESTIVALVRDFTEHRQADEALRESEEKYRSLVENLNVGVYRTSGGNDGKFIHANTAMVEIFGYQSFDKFMEVSVADLYETPEDRERFVNEVMDRGYVKNRELVLINKNGGKFWASCTSTAQFDELGHLKWIDGVIEDITKRKQAEEQLLYDAFHDELTGLPNRALFYDRLSNTMARASRRQDYHYAVLFLDLDRFKLVNDSLGHTTGDQLLIMVANRLSTILRSADTIARLGGDEFVILLDDIGGLGESISISNRIQRELKLPFLIEGNEVYTTASIGIVFHSDDYQIPEDILRDADTAMYRAKRMGKDRYELFDPKMRQDVIARMRIETELRRACERGEFRVLYQPLISITTDQVVGFEALLRWQHPARGLLLPKDFLLVAEENGLIVPIGQWIFQEAGVVINRLKQDFPQDPPLYISVNLSRKQFAQPGLVAHIEQVIETHDLDPGGLVLEITEDVLMEDTFAAFSKITQLLGLGVEIHMDDFGTGYSSLAALHNFPISALKIAREFIVEIGSSEGQSEVIRTIISLARIMNIRVIGEGVENALQLAYLKREKCDIWQGNYCSEPLSPDSLALFLSG